MKTIREVEAPKGLFNPTMQQTVVDWRFHDAASGADANMYTWTNQFTPRMEDPVLQDKFKVRIEEARRHKRHAMIASFANKRAALGAGPTRSFCLERHWPGASEDARSLQDA